MVDTFVDLFETLYNFSDFIFSFILFKHFVACSTQEISIHTKTQYEKYTTVE